MPRPKRTANPRRSRASIIWALIASRSFDLQMPQRATYYPLDGDPRLDAVGVLIFSHLLALRVG